MKTLNLIGPQVRRIRSSRGWSQDLLATKLQICGWDVSRVTVAKIESRGHRVDDVQILFLAEVLGVEPVKLLPPAQIRGRTLDDVLNGINPHGIR